MSKNPKFGDYKSVVDVHFYRDGTVSRKIVFKIVKSSQPILFVERWRKSMAGFWVRSEWVSFRDIELSMLHVQLHEALK